MTGLAALAAIGGRLGVAACAGLVVPPTAAARVRACGRTRWWRARALGYAPDVVGARVGRRRRRGVFGRLFGPPLLALARRNRPASADSAATTSSRGCCCNPAGVDAGTVAGLPDPADRNRCGRRGDCAASRSRCSCGHLPRSWSSCSRHTRRLDAVPKAPRARGAGARRSGSASSCTRSTICWRCTSAPAPDRSRRCSGSSTAGAGAVVEELRRAARRDPHGIERGRGVPPRRRAHARAERGAHVPTARGGLGARVDLGVGAAGAERRHPRRAARAAPQGRGAAARRDARADDRDPRSDHVAVHRRATAVDRARNR